MSRTHQTALRVLLPAFAVAFVVGLSVTANGWLAPRSSQPELARVSAPGGSASAPAAAPATPHIATNAPLTPKPSHGEAARLFARQMPREHIMRYEVDDAVAGRAWTNFINALDYEHVYFLRSDIDRLREAASTLDDRLKEGDIGFAFDAYETYKERVRDRCEFVAARLRHPFDFTTDESYRWKRKDAPWPATEAERDELWGLRLKNEMVARLVSASFSPTNGTPGTNVLDAASQTDWILKRYQHMRTLLEDYDSDWVAQAYLSAFARAYDPHSDYMSPSVLEDFGIEMKLSLVGIGALLSAEDGAAKIVRLIPGGPADRDKRAIRLMPGDKIIAVGQAAGDMVDTLHWPLSKVVRLIRGEKGTRVRLTVIPASDPTGTTTKRVDLLRDEVKLEEQAVKSSVDNAADSAGQSRRLGVLRVPAFYMDMKAGAEGRTDGKSVTRDIEAAIESLQKEKVEGIVLDLRGNGGGSLIEAVRVAGLFIPVGPVVQVKENFRPRVLPDMDPRVVYGGPMIVLVNRLSASASEIVAGALQDYGRAVIVGDSKTHGKGSVQTIVDLDREGKLGAIKATNAMYFRINGSSTQLRGISPDILLPSPLDYYPDLGEEGLPNPIPWSQTAPVHYVSATGLEKVIVGLKSDSERRRLSDPKFHAYTKLLQRIETVNRTSELPLNLAARTRLAQTEKEMADLQRQLEETEDGGEGVPPDPSQKKRPDIVLDEGLRILAELAMLQPATVPPAQPAAGRVSVSQWILDMMKESP
jgi:carboxyl-terminal processing protease